MWSRALFLLPEPPPFILVLGRFLFILCRILPILLHVVPLLSRILLVLSRVVLVFCRVILVLCHVVTRAVFWTRSRLCTYFGNNNTFSLSQWKFPFVTLASRKFFEFFNSYFCLKQRKVYEFFSTWQIFLKLWKNIYKEITTLKKSNTHWLQLAL